MFKYFTIERKGFSCELYSYLKMQIEDVCRVRAGEGMRGVLVAG